jgi:hypothetical protein
MCVDGNSILMYIVFSISPAELGEETKTEPKNITLLDVAGYGTIHKYRTAPILQRQAGLLSWRSHIEQVVYKIWQTPSSETCSPAGFQNQCVGVLANNTEC